MEAPIRDSWVHISLGGRMSSFASSGSATLPTTLWVLLFGVASVFCQDLVERDALCNKDGCFVAYFQQKTFLESWRTCRERGGNLAITKHQQEADAVAHLLSHLKLPDSRSQVMMWIGLQRQPRQCSSTQPLRGFSWTTGDQDTEFTNWPEEEESPGSCSTPRCVVVTYSTQERSDNFKWTDRSCSVSVEGFICHYAYKGMCAALNEEADKILYKTPFGPVRTLLTHVPPGSLASVTCSSSTEEQSVSCSMKSDGSVGWSRNSPLCLVHNWCDQDNGGCEHFCRLNGLHSYCECADGYRLSSNEQSCEPLDVCQDDLCEFECVPLLEGHRCACPEGFMLASDKRSCQDVDECLQEPCEQLCVNVPGTFECQCGEGYVDVEGVCEDIDECVDHPCEHVCENTPGSHVCHCYLGFSPALDDTSRCQDIDECQESDTCQHMCVNYQGEYGCYCEEGYELRSDQYSCRKKGEVDDQSAVTLWVTHQPGGARHLDDYEWNQQQSQTDWTGDREPALDWLTDQPRVEGSDVIWVTSPNFKDAVLGPSTERPGREEDQTEETREVDDSEGLQPTPSSNMESSTTPYWYEADGEETTVASSVLYTSTFVEGAWNWWPRLTTPSQEVEDAADPRRDHNIPVDTNGGSVQTPEDKESGFLGSTEGQGEAVSTEFTPPSPSSKAGKTGGDVDSVHNQGPNRTSTWLLVGILVPIGIFIVVMVALGITFCTRCVVQPRGKEATNCYHWISGAHDNQRGANPSGGAKTHV